MATVNEESMTDSSANKSVERIKQQKNLFAQKLAPYWQRLSDRERLLLIIALCFVAILLCYFFLVEPLKQQMDVKITQIEQQQNDVLWMQQQQPLVEQLRQQNPVLIREDERPLPALVEQTLAQFKLRDATDRIVPEDNTVQIWMNQAPFETLLNWINSIGKFGVTVQKIDVTPHEEGQGNVNLSLILEK